MELRKGRTKYILDSSIDSALLAVEIYNKPRATFRTQAFITLMIIAWTRVFHAYFQQTIGDKYYYKSNSRRYQRVNGEKKAWDLKTCLNKYGKLSEAQRANLDFFIGLRNKIEHRTIYEHDIEALVFGECQALLYNYERFITNIFGDKYTLTANLAYSLQFSTLRTEEQIQASKRALLAEVRDIKNYITNHRSTLKDAVFDSQEYSIKLIQIPKISNTNRNDLAIEFVKWDELNDKDKIKYNKLITLIKDKVVKIEGVNVGKLKASQVLTKVEIKSESKLSHHDHKCLYVIFGVRPKPSSKEDPFNTNIEYCHYDDLHNDYVYKEEWVDCIVSILRRGKIKPFMWRQDHRQGRRHKIEDYII